MGRGSQALKAISGPPGSLLKKPKTNKLDPALFHPNIHVADITTRDCSLHALGYIKLYVLVLIHLLEVQAFSQGHVASLLVFRLVHLAADLRAVPSSVLPHSVIPQPWDVDTVRRPAGYLIGRCRRCRCGIHARGLFCLVGLV